MRVVLFISFMVCGLLLRAQESTIEFRKSKGYSLIILVDDPTLVGDTNTVVNANRIYRLSNGQRSEKVKIKKGIYEARARYLYDEEDTTIRFNLNSKKDTIIDFDKFLADEWHLLQEVEITDAGSVLSKVNLKQVEGFAIYAGKKTEVINLSNTKANFATNNGRQVFAKIAGLNIWESDAAGVQLGIGGRGLSPNRTSNFNTRQNGYDISADALGYPESYYSPVPDMVERIEVVRGASSLQYGTQFGGLVNFKMKRAKEDYKFHAVGKYTLGSFEFLNLTNQISYGTRKAGFYIAHQYKKGNGFRDYTDFTNQSIYFNAYYNIKKTISFGIDFTKMLYLAQQPGGLTDSDFYKDPNLVLRKRNWFNVNWNLGAFYIDYYINENVKLNTRFFGLFSDRKNVGFLGQVNRLDLGQPREVLAGEFKNIGNETRFLANYKFLKTNNTFLVGTRIYKGQTTAQQGLASTQDGADFNFLKPNDIEYSNYLFPSLNFAAFTENIFRLNKNLSITPGFRFENIDTRSNGYYYQRNFDMAGDTLLEIKYNTESKNIRQIYLAGLGVSYKPSHKIEFFINGSQNYRAINFSDIAIVNPNFKVDPTIKDESGATFDAGFRGRIKDAFTYDISWFYLLYNNRIGEIFKVDDFSYTIIRYRTNIGNSVNYGLESFLELDLIKLFKDSTDWSLPIFINYSRIHATYGESENYAVNGKQVEFVPENMLRAGISLGYKDFYISYNYTYLSEQFSDATNAVEVSTGVYGIIPSYWVMDLSCGLKWKKFSGEVHVNNLTNNYYFTRRATAYPGPGIIPAEIRNIYFSLGIKF